MVEGRLFTSSYDGCLKVWDVSELGDENNPNFKLRYAPRKIEPLDKDQEQTKEIEKYGGMGKLDSNQNQNQPQENEKIMIE
ncbi:hypothetical protein BaRGS_00001379 [Batillaria attramentaria]|uniref:Transducin n=1 Tax=Batillaria attramentaria TaxID=370345 RepID=A0ABD0M7R5_9CAEN